MEKSQVQSDGSAGAPDSAPLIQPAQLLPGDVLLSRPRQPDGLQRRVSSATDSPYSHAGIYLGEEIVAESVLPQGVTCNSIEETLRDSLCVGVLRTQTGFGAERQRQLREFVTAVIEQSAPFHRHAMVSFGSKSQAFFDNQLDVVRANYGTSSAPDRIAMDGYFCSGFIVACYQAVGIIGPSAQVGYPPEAFSPAHLYEDPTFGWLLGFIVPEGGGVPQDDPLLLKATHWREIDETPWWQTALI